MISTMVWQQDGSLLYTQLMLLSYGTFQLRGDLVPLAAVPAVVQSITHLVLNSVDMHKSVSLKISAESAPWKQALEMFGHK